jgi:hypothetical protein
MESKGQPMVVFSLLAILAFTAGALILGNAQSAIHEIEGWLCFILGAMLCSAALLAAMRSWPQLKSC